VNRIGAPNNPCHAVDRGLGDPVEFVASMIFNYLTDIERQVPKQPLSVERAKNVRALQC